MINTIAIVLTGLGLTASLVYYTKVLENSNKTRQAQLYNNLCARYQNATWSIGASHTGEEEPRYQNMGHSMIVSPEGEVVALAATREDELVSATIDLDMALDLKKSGRFNFDKSRRPEMYTKITEYKGIKYPE